MKESANVTEPQKIPTLRPGHRVPPRKALGQHFLADRQVLQQILDAAELGPEDVVVEVGPGRGALTRDLLEKAGSVLAIEMDSNLAASLPRLLGNPANLRVVHEDARIVDLARLLQGLERYKVVANLPYYAASPIIRRFLEAGELKPSVMVVMLQKEVAASMVAADGKMSLLSVAIQLHGVPRIVCYAPPGAFHPPPKVSSAVVRIDPRPSPAVEVGDLEAFFRVVRAGFFAPRKQLRNSLSVGLGVPADRVATFLDEAGVDYRLRPENLSLADWANVYHASGEVFDGRNQGLGED
jgi:16S rRNA (adenine1518-N6/adenine1519-N6)-dimethyltransferase